MRITDEPGHHFISALCWFFLFVLLPAATGAAQGTPKADDYVGAETCGLCHAQLTQFRKTPMAILLSEKYPPEQRGCEACHGPGRAHAEAMGEAAGEQAIEKGKSLIYGFPRHSAKENSARCLGCHQKDEKQSLFPRSRHLGAGVSCVDCHTAHRMNPPQESAKPAAAAESYFSVPERSGEREWLDNRLLREKQPKLCYSCHREIESQFRLPVRHRVNEGLVQCSDCHNPHGSLSAPELRAVGTQACTSCHVEKRGPFVYEHAAVRVEGCTGCHTPHGSINLHLVKRRQERQLCLECHVAPEAANVPHPRLGFQAAGECTRCHIEIHGSNYQKQFLR